MVGLVGEFLYFYFQISTFVFHIVLSVRLAIRNLKGLDEVKL